MSSRISPPTSLCTVEQICGHGGFPNGVPDRKLLVIRASLTTESWRFFTPIFLHVGIIHLAVNMFAQVMMGGPMERMMGKWKSADICTDAQGPSHGSSSTLAEVCTVTCVSIVNVG